MHLSLYGPSNHKILSSMCRKHLSRALDLKRRHLSEGPDQIGMPFDVLVYGNLFLFACYVRKLNDGIEMRYICGHCHMVNISPTLNLRMLYLHL